MKFAIAELAQTWWSWITTMSVQVAILVLAVLLVDRLLARWSWPQLRAALWLAVLIKLVLPPSFYSPASIGRLGMDATLLETEATTSQVAHWAVPAFLIWISGVLLLGGWTGWRYLRLRRQLARQDCGPLPPDIGELLEQVRRRLRLRRKVRARISNELAGPAVVGVLRPIVVLPCRLVETAGRQQLEHVLLHELAHIKRRDPLESGVSLLLQILYWFHPAVWLTKMRLTVLREICCDQTVADVLQDEVPAYRSTLLEFARPLLDQPAFGRLGFIHRHSQLMARLEWLDRPVASKTRLRQATTLLAVGVLAACGLPLAPKQPPSLVSQIPPLEELEGCLQLRYAMLAHMAAQAQNAER